MPDILHELNIKTEPEHLFKAITTQEGLSSWWTRDAEAKPKVGSEALFGFGNRMTVFRMTINALEPGRRVEWHCVGDHPEWKGTRITFEMKPLADGKETALRFAHADWRSPDGWMAPCSYSWAQILERLKHYAETDEPSPYFSG